ncbi:MAG: hypothetical protein ACYTG2_12420 [Planctomycetota bacterium]|jgi:hypothetical protein
MSRLLLLVVLAAGAAGSIAPILSQPELLSARHEPPPQRPWNERTLAPIVRLVRDELPADEPVLVLAPRPDPWNWLRYLVYPHALAYLPSSAEPAWLRENIPAGRSLLVVVAPPGAVVPGPDASAALRARLATRGVERVLSVPGARMDVYRLTR